MGHALIPTNYTEAMDSNQYQEWDSAMNEEFNSMLQHEVWDLVQPPKGAKIVNSKWVYTIKYDENRKIEKYKARLVAAG